MDTINLEVTLAKEINYEERKVLKSKRWIKSVRLKKDFTYLIGISFPQYFYATNAYLISRQSEIDKVVGELYTAIQELDNKIEEAIVTRVDYPFTYLMDEDRSFDSYRNIFEVLGKASNMSSVKSIEEVRKNNKETYTLADSPDIRRAKNKVVIYNQAKKLKDRNEELYQESKKDFPDLDKRMRIEASLTVEEKLKRLDLKKVKKEAYAFVEEKVFNEDTIDEFLTFEGERLGKKLIQKRGDKNFRHREFIYKENPLSYDVVKIGAKKAYEVRRSKEDFCDSARQVLKEKSESENVIYFDIKKTVDKIKKHLKKERMKPTK